MLRQVVSENGTVSHPFFFHGVFLLTKSNLPPFLLHSTSGVGSSSSSPSPCALPYQNSAVSMSLHSLGETMTESHTPGPHPAPHPPLVPTFPHSVVKIHQERSFHATMESLRESYFTSIPQKLQRSG